MKPSPVFHPTSLQARDRVTVAPGKRWTDGPDGLGVSLEQPRALTQLLITYKLPAPRRTVQVGRKYYALFYSVLVQRLSRVWLFAALWTAPRQASLSFSISQSLLRLMSIESMIPSSHLILCCPLLLFHSVGHIKARAQFQAISIRRKGEQQIRTDSSLLFFSSI